MLVSFSPNVLLLINLLLKPRLPCQISSASWYQLSHKTGSTGIVELVNAMQSLWGICLRHPKLLFFSLRNQPSLGWGEPEDVTSSESGNDGLSEWQSCSREVEPWNTDDVSQFNCCSPLNCSLKSSALGTLYSKTKCGISFPQILESGRYLGLEWKKSPKHSNKIDRK